jgi:hypothetical protein
VVTAVQLALLYPHRSPARLPVGGAPDLLVGPVCQHAAGQQVVERNAVTALVASASGRVLGGVRGGMRMLRLGGDVLQGMAVAQGHRPGQVVLAVPAGQAGRVAEDVPAEVRRADAMRGLQVCLHRIRAHAGVPAHALDAAPGGLASVIGHAHSGQRKCFH